MRFRAETRSIAQGSIPFARSILSVTTCAYRSEVGTFMGPQKKKTSSASVQFEKHQPERRRGIGAYVCCGCCCCCCCCLHSLGGLIGAAAATSTRRSPTGGSIIGCYWTVLTSL